LLGKQMLYQLSYTRIDRAIIVPPRTHCQADTTLLQASLVHGRSGEKFALR
jgi:hypothetical protein